MLSCVQLWSYAYVLHHYPLHHLSTHFHLSAHDICSLPLMLPTTLLPTPRRLCHAVVSQLTHQSCTRGHIGPLTATLRPPPPCSCSSTASLCQPTGPCCHQPPPQLTKKGSGKHKAPNKADLPSKVCLCCGRPFTWRKKWAKVWDEVKYCSDRCRGSRTTQLGAPAAQQQADS